MKLQIVQHPSRDREHWYRIEERERNKTKPVLPIGARIQWSRTVIRAGYYWEPTDMPIKEMNEQAIVRVIKLTGLDEQTVQDFIISLSDKWGRGCSLPNPKFSTELYHLPLKNIYYVVRGKWCTKQTYPENARDLRTFWYADHEPLIGKIVSRPMRLIGSHVPGSSCGYDWEPAYLDERLRQQLYEVYLDDSGSLYAMFSLGHRVLVHPLDAREL